MQLRGAVRWGGELRGGGWALLGGEAGELRGEGGRSGGWGRGLEGCVCVGCLGSGVRGAEGAGQWGIAWGQSRGSPGSVGSRGFAGGGERGRFGVTWGEESLWDLGGVSSLGETWRGSTLALGGVALQ